MQVRFTPALVCALACCLSGTVFGAKLDSATVDTSLTYSYGTRDDVSVQAELEITPTIDWLLSRNVSLTASARVRLDQRDALEPGAYEYETYTRLSRPFRLGTIGTLEIRDLYLEWRAANGVTRIGKQQIVWGRLDGLKVLDLINPQDFREFIDDELDASRISLWSAYFDYSFGNWRTEFAIIPDSSAHVIPEAGAWYELTAPRFRFGSRSATTTVQSVTERPRLTFSETAMGLRLSRQLGRVDVSAVAYSGVDPEPLGRVARRNGATVVERFYERREALGLSFDVGLGRTVLRGEYALQPNRAFNTRANAELATVLRHQHRGAIGLDIEAPLDVFMNIQYVVDRVTDAPATLVRPDSDHIATLFMRRMFAYDTVSVELRWYHSFTDNDRRISTNIAYALNDATSLSFSARYASGSSAGLFGQFAERDVLMVGLQHTF